MSKAKTNNMIKRIVDADMSVLLLLLMAYQVTGEMAHEWIGIWYQEKSGGHDEDSCAYGKPEP